MARRVAINHKSLYRYDRHVHLSPHIFRLKPAAHCRTPITAYSLRIEPEKHFINWQQDPFGNYQARVVFPEPTPTLSVEVDLVADMTVINPFDFFLETGAENYPFVYEPQRRRELTPFLEIKESGPLLTTWLAGIPQTQRKLIDFLVDINRRLPETVKYTMRMEPGIQPCEQTLETQTGSCRDTGWLLVQILRHLGLAARFVSGYLVQLVADQKPVAGPAGPSQDFTDLHAWCEVYAPGAGWIGLDPTSGLFAGEGHIPLACVPDPVSAAPVTGYTAPCETEFTYSNTVQRLHETPRVTKPYTETQWATLNALGEQVDAAIIQNDTRLTMGGKPTFVSIDDTADAVWDTEVDSPKKREFAAALLGRLHGTFGPGGALYYGQEAWQPGEVSPRWKFGCFWRKDAAPIWRNERLLADPYHDYGFTTQDAAEFSRQLVKRLRLSPDQIVPAYEDSLFYLWTESQLPANIDPLDVDFKDASERHRLVQLLQTESLGEPIGYALPLRWDTDTDCWDRCIWRFRGGHLFLTPGDSPMGLRLPLASITETGPDSDVEDPQKDCRTALCIEPRDGRLHVFMPPLTHSSEYLQLLEAVEATAEMLNTPVILEGYEVPEDPQIEVLSVTPAPGVIQVDLPPAKNWQTVVHNTTTLYTQARLAGLGAEKFMLDGKHTGTGGGNHIVVGGPTLTDSPFLRQPHLLRSLITYWQHHPGLSYLFSGPFIGAMSESPRIDEGRAEPLYELEIAFDRLPSSAPDDAEGIPPSRIDRILKSLTGDGQRGEFGIDKLYPPDSVAGNFGQLELRAFEMPPHAEMSIVQMLLVRTLIAKFWRAPYTRKFIRWGTALHDRFLLPHSVRTDVQEVVTELQAAGYPFEMVWLDPFFEFRFPKLGSVNAQGIEMELRMAIEPWHVLDAGVSRFVDSSVERLQVRVSGLTASRYLVMCNGHPLMLHNTGRDGEYIGGVRYQAWQPAVALHPTMEIHAPLVFDIVDRWNGRSIGGCTYHVSHPGGRNYETLPVNAYEAEARRVSRFVAEGHTPGPITVPPTETDTESLYTLDLRRGSNSAQDARQSRQQ